MKFNPETDIVASNMNYRFNTYFLYKADPKTKAIYIHSQLAFPEIFSVISRTLKKIKAENFIWYIKY